MTNQKLQNVSVIGLGKIGLTLATVFANNGYKVFGVDINKDVVESINSGISHIKNEPGIDGLLSNAHERKQLEATTETAEAVANSEIIVVIVPVLVDKENNIDYQWIDLAVQELARGVKKGSLVVFETTLPPGDTEYRFGKKIEEISGLSMGEDFYLSYSPERVYSNRIIQDLKSYPKVVSGINKKSLDLAANFYKKALGCELIEVSSLETAEFSKIAECVYRDVNIALANELAIFAEKKGVQMSEVITASNSQPYSNIHYPGIGVGGHCIPVYPYFFINKGLDQGLTTLSRKINDNMANYAISKIEKEIDMFTDKNILILGLSYRENVKEPTKSTTLLLMEHLRDKKANVFVNDPLFTDSEIKQYGVNPLSLTDSEASSIDVIILQSYHKEYEHIDLSIFTNCKVILDGRNKLDKDEISKLGIKYEGIGN